MSINTLDAAIAGELPPDAFLKVGTTMKAVGILHSLLYASGLPGASVAPAPGVNGAALTSYAGQLPFSNPVSGAETRLRRFRATANIPGTLFLVDRLWHNSGLVVTTTTEQTLASGAFPARDRNGSANGVGVMVGVEVATATTNASAITNMSMNYTDSDGNASNTATMSSFPATAVAGTFVPFQLAAGDKGVRSIQGVTLGTSLGAGAINLVAYRVLTALEISIANVGKAIDTISGNLRLWDNTVPYLLWMPTSTSGVTVMGELQLTQG